MIKYFKGFDTLRAFAALIVVWSHLELLKKGKGLNNLHDSNFWFMPGGHIAVILFFVLSGFLITYLLVKEKEIKNKIDLKKFYLRRVFRIWPLYYLIIILSVLFVKSDYSFATYLLCLTLFPNIAAYTVGGWSGSPQIWSIGVEEQFYLLWPIILMKLPEKRILQFLGVFIVIYTALPFILYYININTIQSGKLAMFFNGFFYGTKFNCMALGALFGYIVAKDMSIVRYFKNKALIVFFIVLSVVLTFSQIRLPYLNDEFFALIYAIVIVGLAVNPDILIDNNITVFLGKISYGIYMYHWMITLFVLKVLPYSENIFLYNIQLYLYTFGLTILISWISFHTIEKMFLQIKKKYEIK